MDSRMRARLEERHQTKALRDVLPPSALLDFSSNDYLGLASSGELAARVAERLQSLSATGAARAGAGASRLLGGNFPLLEELEAHAAAFHRSEAALFFPTGYAAQSGLISTVAARGDLILYDALVHASAHEGMRLSPARRVPFAHNDPAALAAAAETAGPLAPGAQVFVLVESIYSMDGDLAPLADIATVCQARGWQLIVDEAHAGGLAGPHGEGLVYALDLQDRIFARVITYGKAFGAAGGMVLGSALLRRYLINYCRAFIYSTGPLVSQVVTVQEAYALVAAADAARARLRDLRRVLVDGLAPRWHLPSGPPERDSPSAIVPIYCPGNEQVLALSAQLAAAGYDLKAVRAPTVAAGGERLRCGLHADQAGVGGVLAWLGAERSI
jgi:8-amino-7-oxononanoate synthase